MRYTLGLVASASVVLAATHDVQVGPLMQGSESFVFVPDTLTAAMGDTINFHFYNPGGHSVAQSAFSSPCMPMAGGIWSGFMDMGQGESNMVFSVPVTSTDPMWLYCATNDHCNEGMVMAVNPGSMSLATYKMAASNANGNNPPANVNDVTGGSIVAAGAAAMPSSSSSSMAASSSSMAATSSSMMPAATMSSSMAPAMTSSMMPAATMAASSSAAMMPSMTSSSAAVLNTGAASNMKAPAAAAGLAGAIGAWALI